MPNQRTVAVALVSMALLTACANDDQSRATTTATTASSTSTQSRAPVDPATQAPPVKNPLTKADSLEDEPCKSLTEAQLQQFVLKPGGYDRHGMLCNFGDPAKRYIAEVMFRTKGSGLSTLYAIQAERRLWHQWEPTEIDGYPAVLYRSDKRQASECQMAVGIADSSYFNVRYYFYYWRDYQGEDTCGLARNVTTAVFSTVKASR